MTGGWAVVGVRNVGLGGHSVRCLVRLLAWLIDVGQSNERRHSIFAAASRRQLTLICV